MTISHAIHSLATFQKELDHIVYALEPSNCNKKANGQDPPSLFSRMMAVFVGLAIYHNLTK
jgi:hypothetical protein